MVVVAKRYGRYKEIKSFGCSSDEKEIGELVIKAKHWIDTYGGRRQLDFDGKRQRELEETERVVGIRMPENGGFFTKTMFLTKRHMSIMPLFDNRITQN